jgi:hypothetical protein
VLKLKLPPKDIAPYHLKSNTPFKTHLAEEETLRQHAVILGGDAQFDAWARITEEFPELRKTGNRGQMIDPDKIEYTPLRCQVLKVPHHMSKHAFLYRCLKPSIPGM